MSSNPRIPMPPIDDMAEAIRNGDATVRDIAEAHGCTVSAVKKRLNLGGYSSGTGERSTDQRIVGEHKVKFAASDDRAWHSKEPSCFGEDPELWFPHGANLEAREAVAKDICGGCGIREQCLDLAMRAEGECADQYRFGIFGGLNPEERGRLHRILNPIEEVA